MNIADQVDGSMSMKDWRLALIPAKKTRPFTQREMAQIIGITSDSYRKIEAGHIMLRRVHVLALCWGLTYPKSYYTPEIVYLLAQKLKYV